MKITLVFLLALSLLSSCTSRKKVLDSWMGSTKQNLIMTWGPPARTEDDGNGGQVMVYAHQVYIPQYGMNYWDYKMMYCDRDGKIYHWRTSRQNIPPTQVLVSFR